MRIKTYILTRSPSHLHTRSPAHPHSYAHPHTRTPSHPHTRSPAQEAVLMISIQADTIILEYFLAASINAVTSSSFVLKAVTNRTIVESSPSQR